MHGMYPVLSVPQSHAFAAGTRHRSNMVGFITPRKERWNPSSAKDRPPLAAFRPRISLFVTYTPFFDLVESAPICDSGSEEMTTHPPTYHLAYLNTGIPYITSISSQPVFGLYLCTTRRPVRHDAPRAYCILHTVLHTRCRREKVRPDEELARV